MMPRISDCFRGSSFRRRHCRQIGGLKINHCYILHLKREYIKQGEIDCRQFFVAEEATDRMDELAERLEERIAEMLAVQHFSCMLRTQLFTGACLSYVRSLV